MKRLSTVVILSVVFVLTSCAGVDVKNLQNKIPGGIPGFDSGDGMKPSPPLENTIWELKHIGQDNPIAKSQNFPFLKLSAGKVVGFGGCNQFNGSYVLSGTTLKFGTIAITKMTCPAITNENAFMKELAKGSSYQIKSDQMVTISGEMPLLLFKEKKQ
ncbi:MAG: META domain-containing protein [Leptonema sp. (in: Bacteria)]|nr:META domain-containing protein [Leptonema sp. (in: bacteria)]